VAVTQIFREYGSVYVKIRRDGKQMPFAFCQYTVSSGRPLTRSGLTLSNRLPSMPSAQFVRVVVDSLKVVLVGVRKLRLIVSCQLHQPHARAYLLSLNKGCSLLNESMVRLSLHKRFCHFLNPSAISHNVTLLPASSALL
jgi:hypothetical protein